MLTGEGYHLGGGVSNARAVTHRRTFHEVLPMAPTYVLGWVTYIDILSLHQIIIYNKLNSMT